MRSLLDRFAPGQRVAARDPVPDAATRGRVHSWLPAAEVTSLQAADHRIHSRHEGSIPVALPSVNRAIGLSFFFQSTS
jgi:hypothetical protein